MGFSYYLKKKTGKAESFIWISYRFDKQRLRYSTGIKIENIFWNDTRKKIKRTAKGKTFEQAMELNNRLNFIEDTTENAFNELKAKHGSINAEMFKTVLDEKIKGIKPTSTETEKPTKHTFFGFLESVYLPYCRAKKSLSSLKSYRTLQKQLIEFGKHWKPKNPVFDFEDIDLNFYYDFTLWLENDLELGVNTVGKRIASLKAVLNDATERGINKNLAFKLKRFKVERKDVFNVFLNKEEIKQLFELDLSEYSKGYNTARDFFVIGCWTGLRYSDFKRLKKHHIKNNKIYITTEKTKNDVIIPLHPYVKAIFEKHNWHLPPALANQPMNRYLKLVAQLAEINEPFQVEVKKGKLTAETTRPKFELIKTHTARRSFATNAFKAGIKVLKIRLITGHKDDRSFYKYVKIDKEENATDLENHELFQIEQQTKLKAV